MDTTQLLNRSNPNTQQQSLQPGFLSTKQPAPTSPNGVAYVVVDDHTTDYNYACSFDMDHGDALPQQGCQCLVGFDYYNVPYLVWWEGDYSNKLVSEVATLQSQVSALQTLLTPVTAAYTFANGWRQYEGSATGAGFGPLTITRLGGVVYYEGIIDANGGSFVAYQQILQLPVGFRPSMTTIHIVESDGGSGANEAYAQIRVTPTGVVEIGDHGGAANPVGWMSMNGIFYVQGG